MSLFDGRGTAIARKTITALAFAAVFAVGLGVGMTYGDAATLLQSNTPLADLRNAIVGGPARVNGVGASAPTDIEQSVDFAQFWQVWRDLKSQYYDQPVDDVTLFYGAIRGMVAAVGDPYTAFFEPKESETFLDDLSGAFSGIGAQIGKRDGELQVIAPLPDSPAEKAGVRARDLIAAIDGVPAAEMSVDEAVSRIRGPEGTSVTLLLGRVNPEAEEDAEGILETIEVTIVRETIEIRSVHTREAEPGIYVIELQSFNADSEELFLKEVQDIRAKGNLRGVILDVRNDPGGYLDVAVGIAGVWLGDALVVQERERGAITDQYHGHGPAELRGVDTVVLVNEGSASASEIVAGALQDANAATLVGAQTFGKGSVQEFQEYADGSALKVTVAEWLTPNGRSINHEGITPDVVIELTEEHFNEGTDPQLEKALELIRTGQAKP